MPVSLMTKDRNCTHLTDLALFPDLEPDDFIAVIFFSPITVSSLKEVAVELV